MGAKTSPWWPLAVAVAAVLVHLNALGNGFALDDVPLVERNPAIVSIERLPLLFAEAYWNVPGESYGLYRPLTVASLAVNRALSGAGPLGFHLANVLLHAAVSVLAWFAMRGAGVHYGTALAGALLFAVHPLHTEAVVNVAGRAELLCAAFVLGTWLAHRRAEDAAAPAGRWRLAACGCYFAAILSKESGVLLPLLLAADDAMRRRRTAGRELLSRYGGYGLALAAMLVLRSAALGAHQAAEDTIPLDNPAAAAGLVPRWMTALWVQAKYAGLVVWPRWLSSDYSFDAIPVVSNPFDPRLALGLIVVALLAAGVVWGWRRSPPVATASLVWIVFSLPTANFLFPTGTIMAERLAYLPSLGACLAAGHLAAAWAARPGARLAARRIAVVTIASLAVLALGARTWARSPAWKDNLTLATVDVLTYPRSAKLQAGAGIFLAAAGRAAEAEAHFRRAIEIYPAYAQMHFNLAVLLARRGVRDEAEAHLRRAIELAPGNPRPRALLRELAGEPGR